MRQRLFSALIAGGIALGFFQQSEARAENEPTQIHRCADLPPAPNVGIRDPLVFTYFYYWYSEESLDDPALAQRPPAGHLFDWREAGWHAQQLDDMHAAGVDVALPVYWGTGEPWSLEGLDALIMAREQLLRAGHVTPALGLFLDSNFMSIVVPERPELNDLTYDSSLDFLVDEITAFFDRVPACHRLTVDGRPLIFFWRPDTEDGAQFNFAGNALTTIESRLEERLGGRPLIVRERTWDVRALELGVTLDPGPVFAWGSALSGPLIEQQTVAVGPGYDDRHLVGRVGYLREREAGLAFQRDLRVAALSGAPWLLLETWNEQWETTAIAETAEQGRTYIDLAGREAALFRAVAEDQPRDAWVDLGTGTANYLQHLAHAPEERGTPAELAGKWGSRPLIEADGAAYFHFGLPPRLQPHGLRTAVIEVEYLDSGTGSFRLEYETEPHDETDEVYTGSEFVEFTNTGEWRSQRFTLPDVGFQRLQYAGYGDFRIQDLPGENEESHVFGRVIVQSDRGTRPIPLAPGTLSDAVNRGGPLPLQWRGVAGAASYRVEVTPASTPHGGTGSSVGFSPACGSAEVAAGAAASAHPELTCWLADDPRWSVGLYQWRVEALDTNGVPLGTPSDWAFVVRR